MTVLNQLGQLLPLAVGIAISPIPIIATILVLLSPQARRSGVAFMLGWLAGIVVAVVVFTLLSSVIPESDTSVPHPIKATIQLLAGLALLFMAVRQWRNRPQAGTEPTLPGWMGALDSMPTGKVFGLGFLLAAVNPKNLVLAIGAGVSLGSAALPLGSLVIVIVIFVVIAGSTVSVLVIANLVVSRQIQGILASLRVFLVGNNAIVMSVLLLLIGVVMMGKAFENF